MRAPHPPLPAPLLVRVPSQVGWVRVSEAHRAAEGLAAGGDFYDALPLPGGRAAFLVGDVCGHGRRALGRTTMVRAALRGFMEAGLEPRRVLAAAGLALGQSLGDEFATAVVAVHDVRAGTLTYACAGHPPPLVAGAAEPELLVGSSPPLGLGLATGLRQTTLALGAGAVACLYTDGLAEARVGDRVLGRPAVGDILEDLGAAATASGLLEGVTAATDRVTDDMAALVLTPAAGRPDRGRVEELVVARADVASGLAGRFLEACGCPSADAVTVLARVPKTGRAVLRCQSGSGPTRTSILPMF